ncbi:hypothetical protein BJV77DRAFT_218649 [Russula vinacea]|jgi:3-oxoacyl-ACP reductase-like protein|nr:hypothetical protein BJV77DRAFT_218649 [Russula vinacea]
MLDLLMDLPCLPWCFEDQGEPSNCCRHLPGASQVILPLSPDHGMFGDDKTLFRIPLETIFKRWSSETWGGYLRAVIW